MSELTEREKVILLATEIMGWNVFGLERHGYDSGPAYETTRLIENVEHAWNVFAPGKDAGHSRLWSPFCSISDAYEMESALPEAKRDEYSRALWQIFSDMKAQWASKFAGYWYFTHATAAQRCDAAIAALELKR